MAEYTYFETNQVILEEGSEFGSIIRIPGGKMYNNSGESVVTNTKWFVLFKPNPGVHVLKCLVKDTSSLDQPDYEPQWETRSMNLLGDRGEYTSNGKEYLSSCIHIDDDWEFVKKVDAEPLNSRNMISHIKIIAEQTDMQLKIIGNDQCDECLFYKFTWEEGADPKIVIHRQHTGNTHTYTNILGFDWLYNTEGDYSSPTNEDNQLVREKVHQFDIGTRNPDVPKDSYIGRFGEEKSNFIQGYSCTINNSFGLQIDCKNIKTILMYIDAFLAIFQASFPYGESDEYNLVDETRYKCGKSLLKVSYSTLPKTLFGDESTVLEKRNTQKFLYNSYYDYIRNKDIDRNTRPDDDRLNRYIENGEDVQNIPYKHRWVCLFNLNYNYPISGYYNIVRQVTKGKKQLSLEQIAKCNSLFHRFTDYWYVRKVGEDDSVAWDSNEVRICHNEDFIPEDKLYNKIVIPIVKPWAAVEFVLHCDSSKGGGSFGSKDSTGFPDNIGYKYLHRKLDKNYGAVDDDWNRKHYYTRIYASANLQDGVDKNAIVQYCKTDSPFRVEFLKCHGSRIEYNDIDSKKDCSYICSSENPNKWWTGESLDELHFLCTNLSSTSITKFLIFDHCCYGQGITRDNYSRRSPNSHIFTNLNQFCGYTDTMAFFDANATHTGIGNIDRVLVNGKPYYQNCEYASWPVLRKIIKQSKHCSDIAQNFNNFMIAYRTKAFKLIEEFYINNFELMCHFLPSDIFVENWKTLQPYILADIRDNGNTYFSRDEQEPYKDSNGNYMKNDSGQYIYPPANSYIDNFIAPDVFGKRYRIHNSFIGYILHNIDGILCNFVRYNSWPNFLTLKKHITEKITNIFANYSLNVMDYVKPSTDDEDYEPNTDPRKRLIWMADNIDWDKFDNDDMDIYAEEIFDEVCEIIDNENNKWDTLNNNIWELKNNIEKNSSNTVLSTLVSDPRCFVSGKFAQPDAEFMRNPDKEEDAFLSSDADLEELRNTTKNNS